MSNHPDYDPLAAFLARWFVALITLVGVVVAYHFGRFDLSITFAYLSGMASWSTLGHI